MVEAALFAILGGFALQLLWIQQMGRLTDRSVMQLVCAVKPAQCYPSLLVSEHVRVAQHWMWSSGRS